MKKTLLMFVLPMAFIIYLIGIISASYSTSGYPFLDNGLVMNYGFEQGSGTIVVDSLNRYNMTSNSSTWVTGGSQKLGTYAHNLSRASSQFIRTTSNIAEAQTTDITINGWVNILVHANQGTSPPTTAGIFKVGKNVNDGSGNNCMVLDGLDVAAGKLVLSCPNNWNAGTNIQLNTWVMITQIFRTNGNEELWVNGTQIISAAQNGSAFQMEEFWMGKSTQGAFFLAGRLDEVSFWNRTLNSTEIGILYNSGSGLEFGAAANPPKMTLNYPIDGQTFDYNTLTFSITPKSEADTSGITVRLWGNWTGTWHNNATNSSSLNGTQTNFTVTGIPAPGTWRWSAQVTDSVGTTTNTTNFTFTIDPPAINVTLIRPSTGSSQSSQLVNFTAQVNPETYSATNATINIWHANGTLFNTTTNSLSGTSPVNTSFNISNFIQGSYVWNVRACQGNGNGSNCTSAVSNWTFDWALFQEDANNFNSNVLETSQQTFVINVTTTEGFNVQNGTLVYNGTSYPQGTVTNLSNGSFSIAKTIFIPPGIETFNIINRSFFWNLTLVNTTSGSTTSVNTSTQNQTVRELGFSLCSGNNTIPMLNFTMYDENTNKTINATSNPVTWESTFAFGNHASYLVKNYSFTNLSVNTNRFDFCTNNQTNSLITNMEALFSATGYTEKNYYLTNATLTNTTSIVPLYLLNESDAIEFFITVTTGLSPLTSATVTIQKFFIGEGVFKTVEIDKTNTDDGLFTAYLDLDRRYRFTVVDSSGNSKGTVEKVASCDVAPCELTLVISETELESTLYPDVFAAGVLYNITFNQSTKILEFEFVDTTGLATSFRMQVIKGTGNATNATLISDQEVFTTAGSLTVNLSNYTSGDFTAKTYVARSPYTFIDYYFFTISELTETLGLLGLFVALIVVLIIIFGLAYSPPMLILSVPLALTSAKLIGIVSVSETFIVLTYVLAFIALLSMNR